jgi:hypothetical protein
MAFTKRKSDFYTFTWNALTVEINYKLISLQPLIMLMMMICLTTKEPPMHISIRDIWLYDITPVWIEKAA